MCVCVCAVRAEGESSGASPPGHGKGPQQPGCHVLLAGGVLWECVYRGCISGCLLLLVAFPNILSLGIHMQQEGI